MNTVFCHDVKLAKLAKEAKVAKTVDERDEWTADQPIVPSIQGYDSYVTPM